MQVSTLLFQSPTTSEICHRLEMSGYVGIMENRMATTIVGHIGFRV